MLMLEGQTCSLRRAFTSRIPADQDTSPRGRIGEPSRVSSPSFFGLAQVAHQGLYHLGIKLRAGTAA